MQNYALLTEVGRSGVPVLLKRGLAATVAELLLASEYILREGNERVVLCERGIRTFETSYRFTLDLTAIPVLSERTHLPVIVDPSHAAGRREWVLPLSLAAAAVGAAGVIVEVHPDPESALCDAAQAIAADELATFVDRLRDIAEVARCGVASEPAPVALAVAA
jgi:3-deoxy-7-phosphoheptulonate synthase